MEKMEKSVIQFNKKVVFIFLSIIMIASLVSMTGCDDEDSYEAKLNEAIYALDRGDWAAARAILEGMPQTPEVVAYLSNTYSGPVGLDLFNIIDTINKIEDDPDRDDGSIDMIGELLGDDDGTLSRQDVTDKLADISTAIDLLSSIEEDNDDLTDDQKMQLALASTTRSVLVMADLIYDSGQLEPGEEIQMTEEWLEAHEDIEVSPSDEELDMITQDVQNIESVVDVLDENNDIQDDFDEFANDIDSNGDDVISADELNNYLDTLDD